MTSEELYRIDFGNNSWDGLGVINEDGEQIGILVAVRFSDGLCPYCGNRKLA